MPETKQEQFYAWLAGFIDGDGSIGIYKIGNSHQIRLRASNTSKDIIDYIHKTIGLGYIAKYKPKKGRKSAYEWIVVSRNALAVLEQIEPYLKLKKEQASLVMNYQKTLKNTGHYRIPKPILLARDKIKNRIAVLNFRGALT